MTLTGTVSEESGDESLERVQKRNDLDQGEAAAGSPLDVADA